MKRVFFILALAIACKGLHAQQRITGGLRRVRCAHTASPTPRPKMGYAIFRLCPPTTLQVVARKTRMA